LADILINSDVAYGYFCGISQIGVGIETMLNLAVCIKQVPMVSELPWNNRTGTLRRDLAEGMMNPACRQALEAALQLRQDHGAHITVLTMGPSMAEEVLREAMALGADRGVLLTDARMAGADTFASSFTLARAISHVCPQVDLVLCGCCTSDSETAQVGPQLAEELRLPGVACVDKIDIIDRVAGMQRLADDFLETLEMDLPGLVTISSRYYTPRYVAIGGLVDAFELARIDLVTLEDLSLDPALCGQSGSPTQILDVYSPTASKKNIVLKGAPKKVVRELLEKFGDRIGSAIGKDLQPEEHPGKL
jgi:electron transfer flavoprotein beta subunit